jgi:hypothetical protein
MGTETPATQLVVMPMRLSDGSVAYDVLLNDIVWPAISEDDAKALAKKIAAAIDEHTNETAYVVWR